ncbi:hypothetical protein Glove_22g104 [Diversispora epigaea]|uniref:Uncharacterized protein n=1 Tax=Diversispora epigaea TaxID=1348612 RepID=A0A397JP36_9GLOM|nr:hypothetical protein Glove_22g104 [Diversispora epigaea]
MENDELVLQLEVNNLPYVPPKNHRKSIVSIRHIRNEDEYCAFAIYCEADTHLDYARTTSQS